MLQLQNAQQAALAKNVAASATRDDLESTKLRVETLSSQLQQYHKDVSSVCNYCLYLVCSVLGLLHLALSCHEHFPQKAALFCCLNDRATEKGEKFSQL